MPAILNTILILLFIASPLAAADRDRIALVIGNNDYKVAPLRNPVNDATDMATVLKNNGFKVKQMLNANQRQMEFAIRDFNRSLSANSVGLFYFAGHGLEVDGENYLVPVGALIEHESDVRYEAVAVGRLLDGMQRASNGLNLVVLDACRNNPYSRSFRSASTGLAEMRPASGTLILYATEPGSVAADGIGRNGVFTEQLMKNITKPGMKVEDVFKETAIAVNQLTGGKQVPWYEGVILGHFYFLPASPDRDTPKLLLPEAAPYAPRHDEAELLFWKSVEKKPSPEGYEEYLKQWPDGKFASIARLRISENDKAKITPAMSKEEIVAAFSGKTVEGTHNWKEFTFTRYYDPDGTLIAVSDKKGDRTGKWKALPGQLCESFGTMKCRRVERHGDMIQKYYKDVNVVTYSKFTTGNKIKKRSSFPGYKFY